MNTKVKYEDYGYCDSHTCPKCGSCFKSKKTLKVHLDNPPKHCTRAEYVSDEERIRQSLQKRDEMQYIIDLKRDTLDYDNKTIEMDNHFTKLIAKKSEPTGLLQRYFRWGMEQLTTNTVNVLNHYKEANHNVMEKQKLISETQKERARIEQEYQESLKFTNNKIDAYLEKFGNRAEENAFLNAHNEADYLELTKAHELIKCKLHVIETLMIKKSPEAKCYRYLEDMFGADLALHYQVLYGDKNQQSNLSNDVDMEEENDALLRLQMRKLELKQKLANKNK